MSLAYFPEDDRGRVKWMNNFAIQMIDLGPSLDFTPAEIVGIQNDAAMLAYIIRLKEEARNYYYAMATLTRSVLEAKVHMPIGAFPVAPVEGVPPAAIFTGIIGRLRLNVARIKQHMNYTETMGEVLKILVSAPGFNPETAQPVLTVTLDDTFPLVSWHRRKADGIFLYVDRTGDNNFILLDKIIRTKYLDPEPLPENTYRVTWYYKARYMKDDKEIGLFSDPVRIEVMRV
jgi:hypothetical protein